MSDLNVNGREANVMDLLLRNIDAVAVKKIDEQAKAKKMSRNEYLKIQIEKLAMLDVFEEDRNRFEEIIQTVVKALRHTMMMIEEQQKEIKKMQAMFMMVLDIDEEEMNAFVEEFILKEGDVR